MEVTWEKFKLGKTKFLSLFVVTSHYFLWF